MSATRLADEQFRDVVDQVVEVGFRIVDEADDSARERIQRAPPLSRFVPAASRRLKISVVSVMVVSRYLRVIAERRVLQANLIESPATGNRTGIVGSRAMQYLRHRRSEERRIIVAFAAAAKK